MTAVPTQKRCSRCSLLLPIDQFTVAIRNPDGTPRRWRTICRPCRAAGEFAKDEQHRAAAGTVDGERQVRLPIAPLASYITAQVDRDGVDVTAARYCVSDRLVFRLTHSEFKTIGLDIVDQMFCHADEPGLLQQLYPELYDFPANDAAEDIAA